MAIYGKYITEAFFKSKLDKVEDLINKNNVRRASRILSKVKPKEKDLSRYNKLKEKIDQLRYEDIYAIILEVINRAVKWWNDPRPGDYNLDTGYFQIMSIYGISDQKFIAHIKKKINKYQSLNDIMKYLFGDEADNDEYKENTIKETDKLCIFISNDDYVAFVNLSNNTIYDYASGPGEKIRKTTLKNVGGDYWDEKVIKDVLKKENIRFN